MIDILASLAKRITDHGIKLMLLWINMMLMAALSILCPFLGLMYADPYQVMLVWSWIWGIGAVICGVAFLWALVAE